MSSLLAALGLVFVAELGDKTQLVAIGLGARHRVVPVLTGLTLGYALSNLLSVAVGSALGAALPTTAIGLAGGVAFLGFAAWTLRGEDAGEPDVPDGATWQTIVPSVAATMFVAELGDKTMLATATLAAGGDPLLVWVGATIGITASGAVGVAVGRAAGARLPPRATRLAAAALFAAFGVALIATNL